MTNEAILICDAVGKRFGRTTALRSVSFSLHTGESVAIFGCNGAGKSTLLNIIAALIKSFGGDVTLFGVNVRKADDNTRRRLGFMSHDHFLYADLTAYENLFFYARLYGLSDTAVVAESMLDRFGMSGKSGSVVRDLSRGMKQRLSLARAFLHSPKLLLLDEPYTGLDETACSGLDDMLSRFVSAGGSILMATHDIDRGYNVADRSLVLDGGRIVFETRTQDTAPERFREHYGEILSKRHGV